MFIFFLALRHSLQLKKKVFDGMITEIESISTPI